MDNERKMTSYINFIDEKINSYLDRSFVLHKQMHYCMMSGGKRIRPLLLLSVSENTEKENVLPFACAIEFIHNYSLVHDDLPAMDNDDYRRNNLTCHKKFGEASAILTGDALLSLAFKIMIGKCIDEPKFLLAAQKIIDAAGINGMIKGQVLDIENENKKLDLKMLEQIHLNKTAALIRGSIEAGAVLSGADNAQLQKFLVLGNKLGLAFQIKDDILDEGQGGNKPSYFTIYGKKKSVDIYNDLASEIYLETGKLDGSYDFFKYLVKIIIERKN